MTRRFSRGMSTPAIRAMGYPCRCLCRLLAVQITITRPCRRMTLHFSHIGLTLGRTFTWLRDLCSYGLLVGGRSLVAVGDPAPGQVVRGDLHLHAIAGEDPDAVHPHL